jgi:hypothetical protein
MAAAVVEALADNDCLVLGLDLRSDGAGPSPDLDVATEIPWHAFRPTSPAPSIREARRSALEALSRPELAEMAEYRWILVTWSESSAHLDNT